MKPMSRSKSEIRTYRAKSMQDALQMIREDLGPEATVLQSRELPTGWWERLSRGRHYEIRARRPSIPDWRDEASAPQGNAIATGKKNSPQAIPRADGQDHRRRLVGSLRAAGSSPSIFDQTSPGALNNEDNGPLFELLAELLDADVSESVARELITAARQSASPDELNNLAALRRCLELQLQSDLQTSGPIRLNSGQRRVVALVGPTGVGKTTTIAKLAANLRLKDKLRVGLITVDTYRIAAVDQLRTYADIIDLPMEVVSTPREMRDAVMRMADQDIVFIDTAGRSPRDEVQLQELRSLLQEARVDEVHLVLSAVAATSHLTRAVGSFAPIGVSALLFTKLDEASGLGNLVPLVRSAGLPLSYLGCGQSVPDDIVVADKHKLVRVLLGRDSFKALM